MNLQKPRQARVVKGFLNTPILLELRVLLILTLVLVPMSASAGEAAQNHFDTRFKVFGSAAYLPDRDLQRLLDSTPALDLNLDMRLMWKRSAGSWSFNLESSINHNAGDSLAFTGAPQSTLDQSPADDARRLLNLTTVIDSGEHHRLIHRFDRASLSYQASNWSVTLGRQALSWGSGIVFQPLDLFSPFAPTTVDRDYKAGDDMVNVEYLFANGSDVQVVSILRRNEQKHLNMDEASTGFKWHGFIGESEFEVIGGRHYRDEVLGLSMSTPVGGALVRGDVLLTHLEEGGTIVSGVLNMDYSFTWRERSMYIFGEYFHNGFGTHTNPVVITDLSEELVQRLQRGELFNLQRDYLAGGLQFQWHPLLSQSTSIIINLKDTSSLLQFSFAYEPGDHQRFQLGLVEPLGSSGEEFGGVNIQPGLTTGGGTRAYLRYLYYF